MTTDRFLQSFLKQAVTVDRSSALRPLGWAMGLVLTATVASSPFGAPNWLTVVLSGLSGLLIVFYLFSYVYLLFKDRDALRSEKYVIQKLAIERYGDNIAGFIESIGVDATLHLPDEGRDDGGTSPC